MASSSNDPKVALVTGATRGIGRACASELSRQGYSIAVTGRDPAEVEAIAFELGSDSHGFPADLEAEGAAPQLVSKVRKHYRRIDALVNNAGVLEPALLPMASDESLARMMQVNFRSAFELTRLAARVMERAGSGSIVQIASVSALDGRSGQSVYAASKGALLGLTRAAARELGPKGIRVNAVAPGYIDTDMTSTLDPAERDRVEAHVDLGRLGSPAEVASVVAFLLSDAAAYVHGQVLRVDGGLFL